MKYKLSVIFTTTHADTLGNANRLEIIRFLSNALETIIFTNQPVFVKKLFPYCKVEELTRKNKCLISLINNFYFWKSIADKVNSIPCDAVFMMYDNAPAAFWIKYPVIQYIHQFGERGIKKKWGVRPFFKNIMNFITEAYSNKGLRKSKLVFAVSQPIINLFKSKSINNLQLLPHGMDLKKYQNPLLLPNHDSLKKLKDEGYFIVTYTGWVTEGRGFSLMMNSIKEAVKIDNKIVLVIAGADNRFSNEIESFKKQNNLQFNIINYGIVDVSLVPGILFYADVCLSFLNDVPAHSFSPPQKIIEYFAAGKPVICNKIESHLCLVNHNMNGLILNYDFLEVADAIINLKIKPDLLKTLSANALSSSLVFDVQFVYGNMLKKMNIALSNV